MEKISLTPTEMLIAGNVAIAYHIKVVFEKLKNTYGEIDSGDVDRKFEGMCAEMGVAKTYGIFWAGTYNKFYDGDVGKRLEVRQTDYANGRLILHPEKVVKELEDIKD